MVVDVSEIQNYIDRSGLCREAVAQQSGLKERELCLILQGESKLAVGEYVNICKALCVPMTQFVKQL